MSQNKITLETAQSWATNWRKEQSDVVKAYLIPQEDILELYKHITQGGGQDVRGYLGIYYMTKPCPDYCDLKSPLFTLKP